jgi:uncharacterized lipoprotein YmbA
MMRMRTTLPLAACVLLAGCGIFSRAKNTFYSLDTVPAQQRATMAGTPIGLDGIELPPGIERRGVVVRRENNTLDVRGTHQWASPLEAMVVHTIAFNLANRLPEGMVILPGAAKPAGAMRSLYVVFEELAAGPGNEMVLDARWTLTTTGAPELVKHERITIPLASLESAVVVDGMNQALAQLADRIVGGI